MNKLVIASNNAGKIREMRQILAPYFDAIVSMREAGIDIEVEETGQTFAENARLKAVAIARLAGCAAVSDDSGLEVDALGGEPGVYSARYAGSHGDDEANNAKLIQAVADTPFAQRTARYRCAVCLCYPDGKVLEAQGQCEGLIQSHAQGDGGFGYDPYFYLPDHGCTMAQLSAGEKNRMSHRYHALANLLSMLGSEECGR